MTASVVKTLLLALTGFSLWLPSYAATQLADNPSPYLSMHAQDPVDWRLWGSDVLQRAKRDKKLIFLSIGYFSCHWCHVMQKESYQDRTVADLLNRHFVSVKVDRELRPELDRRLIKFVEEVRGQAGWPLNVFLTPDGYPVTGFTYLPRDDFIKVLKLLSAEWDGRHQEISELARQYYVSDDARDAPQMIPMPAQYNDTLVEAFVRQALTLADELQGGFGRTSKFPSYPQLDALLQVISLYPDSAREVVEFVQLTLDSMASLHLMDAVNGGFFRYTTDPDWHTPHFEKMLYDNAQLAALYLDAEALWPGRGYADTGLRTIDFMLRDLRDEAGGFNASLSAVDVDQNEGAAYLWTLDELKNNLSAEEYRHLLGIWSLQPDREEAFLAKPLLGIGSDLSQVQFNGRIREKLRRVNKPVMPLDNKKLASWNALVLSALVKARQYDHSPALGEHAKRLYQYMLRNFIARNKNGELRVVRFAGQENSAESTLEDYAQLAYALQIYAQSEDGAGQREQAAALSAELVEQAFKRFHHDGRWLQSHDSLIPGERGAPVIQDEVLTSASSVLLRTVFMMSEPAPAILEKSRKQISSLLQDQVDIPFHYASSILLSKIYRNRLQQVSSSSPQHDGLKAKVTQ